MNKQNQVEKLELEVGELEEKLAAIDISGRVNQAANQQMSSISHLEQEISSKQKKLKEMEQQVIEMSDSRQKIIQKAQELTQEVMKMAQTVSH